MVKQLLPKVEPPCVGAKLPPRTQRVPLSERAFTPGVQGAGLDWSGTGVLIHVFCASVCDRMENLE